MPTEAHVSALDEALQKTHVWLKDLTGLGELDNQAQAYCVLRAVLHALRDQLTIEESADLASQLPLIIRGIYFEGWKPAAGHKRKHTADAFLKRVQSQLRESDALYAKPVSMAVFELLNRRISSGEIKDIRHILPGELGEIWPEP